MCDVGGMDVDLEERVCRDDSCDFIEARSGVGP
jgi:hypothetical protein